MSLPILKLLSPNHDARPDVVAVDHLVLHYTGMKSGTDALNRLCDDAAKVSSHYLVEEDGRIFQLVDEGRRAWHAGVASWRGAKNINARSIGIEIVNPGHEHGYRAFPERQITAVIELCQDILHRHDIQAANIVGHSDIASWRKEDPGELFPWSRLAEAGIGLWPQPIAIETDDAAALLKDIGYLLDEPSSPRLATIAFQRRFRPQNIDGVMDHETAALIAGYAQALQNTWPSTPL